MSSGTPTAVRELAYRVLVNRTSSDVFTEDQIEDFRAGLESRDFIRLRYLVTTVIRRKLTLDAVLKKFVSRSVEPDLWELLKLGAAQILFGATDHRHADVYETVEVARAVGNPRWCKFLNGVLRNLDRACRSGQAPELGPNSYPVSSEGELRSLSSDVFPDPAREFTHYISEAFSLPHWLIARWGDRYESSQILKMASWFLSTPRMCLRVNLTRTTRQELIASFESAGMSCASGNVPSSIVNVDVETPVELPGWDAGLFSVQDETAQQAALLLDPQPGECVLDLCSAPGTKTLHLAELMRYEGEIVATDVNGARLTKVRENAKRGGADLVTTHRIGRDGQDIPAGPFDRILIDAPCTNTGVLGKRIDVRWRLSTTDLDELSTLQQRLLDRAAERLKPGGKILYSTCSIEPEENERVVESFLRSHAEFTAPQQQTFLPGSPADGGFQALLVAPEDVS